MKRWLDHSATRRSRDEKKQQNRERISVVSKCKCPTIKIIIIKKSITFLWKQTRPPKWKRKENF